MVNNFCPDCEMIYFDAKITAMNLDEPEFRGYCPKCRKIRKAEYKKVKSK